MIVLGLAYAVIEEAFVTETLFNPDYLGLRLLDYGYISSLGIGAWWTVFVLAIHTIWSTSVPIALVESLTPEARRTPWLGNLGLAVTAILFVIGCILTFFGQLPFATFGKAAKMSADEAATVNIELDDIVGKLNTSYDKINCPIYFICASKRSMGGTEEQFRKVRASVGPLVAQHQNISIFKTLPCTHLES
jgi:hypothetical protein